MTQQSIHDRIMSRSQTMNSSPNGIEERTQPQRNWWKAATLSLLGVVAVGALGFVATRSGAIPNLLLPPASAETASEKKLVDTPFLQHVKQADLHACSTIFPVLGQLLTTGTQYSVQSFWNDKAPDKHAVQALVGMDYATDNYSGPAAGIVFAAPTGSTCEGAMVRVAPFQKSCADVVSMLPKGSQLTNNLAKVAVYTLPENGGNALLLPTGNTCAVISVASAAQ